MKNRTLAALQEQPNLLCLGSVVALAAATTSLEPLLFGLVVEAAYLAFVPRSKWFASRLERQQSDEIKVQRERLKGETLPKLRPKLQKRFARIEAQLADINRRAAADELRMREVTHKLDYLLDKWLQFALKDEQFRVYLYHARLEKGGDNSKTLPEPTDNWARETVDLLQQGYDGDISQIEFEFERETDEDARAVLGKRLEVLRRRREFIARIGKTTVNLSQQLALLEDTFGLIRDELLARAPEQVLGDIEDVVSQTKAMTEVLEAMAPYERMLANI